MKLISFSKNGNEGFGALSGEHVVDLTGLKGAATLRALLEADGLGAAREKLAAGAAAFKLADCTLLPPITNPSKVLCVGINYVEHAAEAGRTVGQYPVIFQRYADTLIGHGATMLKPKVSEKFDYEGELAVVIGKGGGHISKDDAMAHVAGYSCFNDASARDWQFHTHQYGMGKNFRTSGPFGPWLLTADEVPDYRKLRIRTLVNGQELQNDTPAKLAFDVPHLISYISHALDWRPGDVLATGTPSGIGFKRNPPILLKDGDTVDIVIDGLGTLSNPVRDEV
ncbi:MAG: fumarylacetoacetate hydrolase family protein [Rhodoblastus sp.]|nr:fumarylacetoacetate hydrolase family protein [Rhodoblastus sp.]MCA8895331.1 fumarylacetoacetate hydrolase family protein [Amphiplicatus sp.]